VIALPASIAPPAPFPLVIAQSQSSEIVAPGITRTDIRMRTSAGPLVVHVVTIDEREPSVRLGAVVAHDKLVSPGETVSAMANRTGAVAGINADYFDIGNTNQPLNVVVRNGVLLRSPSKRIALVVGNDGQVRFTNVALNATAEYAGARVPVTGVNIWPPQGGASLMTPAYGTASPAPGVSIVPIAQAGNAYVAQPSIAAPPAAQNALAFGPAAIAIASPPPAQTPIALDLTLDPPLSDVREAVGGGPLLLRSGTAVTDPNEPAPEERNVRFPLAGAGIAAPATLLLVTVDGRFPALSIGLTRPEFGALFAGLGADDAMAFDSGGSATLAARVLGDDRVSVLNAPSDGIERPVADGLFAYSSAPVGIEPHLFARPEASLALPGATLRVRGAVIDSGGHALERVTLAPIVAAAQPGPHTVQVRSGPYVADVAYTTVAAPARLAILPERVNLDANASVALTASATDALGAPIALGAVRWSATAGTITGVNASATFRAGSSDALVTAAVAQERASVVARVGAHVQTLQPFGPDRWRFATAPKGAAGSIDTSTAGQLALAYDLTVARAAYANAAITLPGEPLDFAIDVDGDGSGVGLRAAFVNRFGERRALTLAPRVDWTGKRRLRIILPPDLNPPVTLVSLYVVRLGEAPLRTAGTIRFSNAAVTLAGTP
jgi:hypothetical protein